MSTPPEGFTEHKLDLLITRLEALALKAESAASTCNLAVEEARTVMALLLNNKIIEVDEWLDRGTRSD